MIVKKILNSRNMPPHKKSRKPHLPFRLQSFITRDVSPFPSCVVHLQNMEASNIIHIPPPFGTINVVAQILPFHN
jgi:hypothetical protein